VRIQFYIIAVLVSLLMWSATFIALRDSYQFVRSMGVFPNLQLH
jgi:hypothetical protein